MKLFRHLPNEAGKVFCKIESWRFHYNPVFIDKYFHRSLIIKQKAYQMAGLFAQKEKPFQVDISQDFKKRWDYNLL